MVAVKKSAKKAGAMVEAVPPSATPTPFWHALITKVDLEAEEELLRNPYALKYWLDYLQRKMEAAVDAIGARAAEDMDVEDADAEADTPVTDDALAGQWFVLERALKELPGSYKLWKLYLDQRRKQLKDATELGLWTAEEREAHVQELCHCYERALVFLNKMPRIWLDFCDVLMGEGAITRTRRTFDRALRALPISQHKRVWVEYLDFVKECGVVETAIRVQKRYLKLEPGYVEDFIDYLQGVRRYNEAATYMIAMLDAEPYTSAKGKGAFQLWMEMAELLCEHPKEIHTIPVEPILRSGIKRYSDQVGKLWNSLARYWILQGNFEKARDIYEEAIKSVLTVRDFIQVFDAYAEFEESILSAKITQANGSSAEADDIELDLRLARFEKLMDRRPFLVNDVHLRQNPNNVQEWMKRIELWGDNEQKVEETYEQAFATVDAKKAHGRFQDLWIAFAELHESKGDLERARQIFEDAVQVTFKHPDSLAEVYIAYSDMELKNKENARAIEVLARATAMPPGMRRPVNSINYLDEGIPVHVRLFKSIKLWSHYVDLEEALGTVESTKAVYDRIMELKICTPQTVVNFAAFLEDNKYFEESYKVYERGIELFGYPIAFDLFNIYLQKFVARFGGSKLERARDLFEHALDGCPEKHCKAIFLLYGQLEEKHGLAKKAMQIYDRATNAVPAAERHEMFQFYIAKAVEFFGLTSARPIYERALEVLSDKNTREMGLRFAELEMKLGEAERARAIYGHISQLCDPRVDHKFWKVWHDFEVRHGNEETFKEMLRIKRSVQTRYNNEVDFLASQMISNKKRAEAAAAASAAAIAKPSMTFVSGGTTVNGRKVEGGSAAAGTDGKPAAARAVNPDEIAMDLDDDAGEAIAVEAEDEGGAKSAVQFVGAKDRFKAATATAVVSNPDEIAMDDD